VGEVRYIHGRMLRHNRLEESFAFGTGIHILDCIRHLAEATCGGVSAARTRRGPVSAGKEAEEGAFNFHVDLEFGSGAEGRCDILPACGMQDEAIALFGEKGSAVFHMPRETGSQQMPATADLWLAGDLCESGRWPLIPRHVSCGVYGEAVEFISALGEGRPPSPSVVETLDSVALADAVQAGRDILFGRQ
jgi:predicted dehydrogenase